MEDEAPGVDVQRVAGDEAHDARAVLPAPVMAVQTTRLGATGLALGLSVHHADACTMRMFIHTWTSASRCGSTSLLVRTLAHPSPGRRSLAARELLNKAAPNLPVLSASSIALQLWSKRDSAVQVSVSASAQPGAHGRVQGAHQQ